jgi:enoyl-CoA hydratase/carnithine racemase
MTTELQTERHDATLVLRLNGPTHRNALTAQVYAAGIETLNMAEADTDVRAVVLTGANGHFCGGDKTSSRGGNKENDTATEGHDLDAFHQWIEALHCFPKPVIAAVEGVASGSGVSLALACDLIVAADNARFVVNESLNGAPDCGGAIWHLCRAIGRQRALALMWLGDNQSAHDWHKVGLVHTIAPNGQGLNASLAMAKLLTQKPSALLAGIKEMVNEADQTLQAHLQAEKRHILDVANRYQA